MFYAIENIHMKNLKIHKNLFQKQNGLLEYGFTPVNPNSLNKIIGNGYNDDCTNTGDCTVGNHTGCTNTGKCFMQ
jgi:hypothetical protein